VEKEEDFLNFADYFANAIKNKETSYTITKHIDSAVTLNLNLHYDMVSYNPVGNIKVNFMLFSYDIFSSSILNSGTYSSSIIIIIRCDWYKLILIVVS
jgi:hypothetical protein